ncbi:2-hydroxyacid dehydrogenase [Pseudomonas asiatica]|uniref:2-hydroxyacid dehydrogenase n=1 Tax=Pseudomonas asiatica TaxID=2219225 RepID=UPI0018A9D389|nr:glyoxylate/hydroxypyruvate reductase A [Pseudomonas asiatica]MBF8803518.1 glyoxylate/hydroxypyruvate reductase A [Pseudomonas asiatica]
MDILFAMAGPQASEWLTALNACLPKASIRIWSPGDNEGADYILYWKEEADALLPRPGVKAVFNMGAGVDALLSLVRAGKAPVVHDAPLIRLEDAGMARQMVEYSVYYAYRYMRRFDHYSQAQRQQAWAPIDAYSYDNFPVGVLGAGKLGLPVAQALSDLGFDVRVYSRSGTSQDSPFEHFAGNERMPAFLSGLKLLINLLPNTPETVGILNSDLFGQLSKGSYLVNLARGSHLAEADLVEAIGSGRIAGAALDVFSVEPLPEGHSFWNNPAIEITPHISARTQIGESAEQVAEKIALLEKGIEVSTVDLVRGY